MTTQHYFATNVWTLAVDWGEARTFTRRQLRKVLGEVYGQAKA